MYITIISICSACSGAWGSDFLDDDRWIQADLGRESLVFSVITQSRPVVQNWVTSYYVNISSDGSIWRQIGSLYEANPELDTKVTNTLPDDTRARYVRVMPSTWHVHSAMRWELVGCLGPETGR